jgi:hypothetical protein
MHLLRGELSNGRCKLGIDITERLTDPNAGDGMMIIENSEAMKGGPTCVFQGKEIPCCFIGTSPKASITSQLLADMLGHMDGMKIWDREEEGRRPFLLLDGHHSRLELPFLEYIHDPAHLWVVCIGVPYGTHKWQVADASECNGTFKMNVTRVKRTFFEKRPHGKKHFAKTDIIPIINKSFHGSYGNVKNAKKAISARGWGPANYALLLDPSIAKTKVMATDSTPATSSISRHGGPPDHAYTMKNGEAAKFFGELMQDASRDEGRTKKMREQRAETDQQDTYAKKLKKMTRVTSGGMASEHHYHVDEDTFLEMKDRAEIAEADETERVGNRVVAAIAADERRLSAEAAFQSGAKLNTTNLKSLIQSKKRIGDSPMKTTREELELQWNRRYLRDAGSSERNSAGQDREISSL